MGWERERCEMPMTCARAIGKWSCFERTSSTRKPISVSNHKVRRLLLTYIYNSDSTKISELPVRYDVSCFGPQLMGKQAVVLVVFCGTCDPSLGKKWVPLEDSPNQRNRTNVAHGGFWTVHNTWLIVTRRKPLSWPSTRGGRLVEGETSLVTANKHIWWI